MLERSPAHCQGVNFKSGFLGIGKKTFGTNEYSEVACCSTRVFTLRMGWRPVWIPTANRQIMRQEKSSYYSRDPLGGLGKNKALQIFTS